MRRNPVVKDMKDIEKAIADMPVVSHHQKVPIFAAWLMVFTSAGGKARASISGITVARTSFDEMRLEFTCAAISQVRKKYEQSA
jgi:hypothetical protein